MNYGPSFASHLRLAMPFRVPTALALTSNAIIRDGFMGARGFLGGPSALSLYPGRTIDLLFIHSKYCTCVWPFYSGWLHAKGRGEVIGTVPLLGGGVGVRCKRPIQTA